jgi:hypothetical protein
MTQPNARPTWRKSSYSGKDGNCVEVAARHDVSVAVRDSKDPHGPSLSFPPDAWTTFLTSVGTGTFDLH